MTVLREVPSSSHHLTVGQVAAQAGVAPSAVRFYDAHGLLESHRTGSGQRRFDEDAACLIKVAKVAQRVGLTVREIADLFVSVPSSPTPQDWARVSEALVREAEARTAALKACLADLAGGQRLCDVEATLD